MATTGEFIAQILESAGIDTTTEDLKPLLGISVPVPEGLQDKVNANLIPFGAAKNNITIKNEIIGKWLSGTDENLKKTLLDRGISKEVIDEIYNSAEGKNFGNRLNMLFDKLDNLRKSEIEALKTSGKKPTEETEAFKKQIESLQNEIANTKKAWSEETSSLRNSFESERMDDAISRKLLGKKWSDNYQEHIRLDLGKIALNKSLQKDGAKVIRDGEGNLRLVPADNPEGEYYDKSNKKVSFDDYIDSLMAENKFNAVSPTPGAQGAQVPNAVVTQSRGASTTPTSKALEASMADQGMNG